MERKETYRRCRREVGKEKERKRKGCREGGWE
jgi:hypothetical protein